MADLTQSYVHGAVDQPLLGETIGQLLGRIAATYPERPAIISRQQQVRLTYAELHARTEALAAGLLALGLRPGERVGIWSPNNVEWVLTQFATAKAGLVLVNINPAYRVQELDYALNKVGCSALILAASFKSSDYIGMIRTLVPAGTSAASRVPGLTHLIRLGPDKTTGFLNFDELPDLARAADRALLADLGATLQFDDPINIQFTSGTTGAPKGATLTHHNIVNNGFFVGEAMRLTAQDRLCIPVPFYHCFGMVLGNLACVTHGAAIVIPGEGFDPGATLAAVAEERCTGLHGVPTMFIAMLEHADFARFDLSSLRTGIMAGSTCPVEIMRRVIDEMHQPEITIAYGMTETSPVSFQSATTDPLDRRVSTIGRVHPHLEVKIIDGEGRIVPPGVAGELLTRGYSVMRGYWGDPANTATTIDESRWMHTGDLAVIDAAGYCAIVGRIKDLVIRGGENIYPREVEEYLFTHPDIAEVAVFGIPDDRFGEEVCAWIRLRPGATLTADAVTSFCTGQIAHYKVPKIVRIVDAFPMTVTGKIQKFIMREHMVAERQTA